MATAVEAVAGKSGRDRIDGARLYLVERAPGATLKQLLTATLDVAEALTGSTIGFFHFVAEDQHGLLLQAWSTNTLARMCTAKGEGQHYPLDHAGVWADCVRIGKPVVHNDYASLADRRGLPPGHARVLRELTVPVLRGGRICAVVGLGNKPTDYDQADVADLCTLADIAWDIAAHKRAEEALKATERDLKVQQQRVNLPFQATTLGLFDRDLVTGQTWRTPEHDRLLGYPGLQPTWTLDDAVRHLVPEDQVLLRRAYEDAFAMGHLHLTVRVRPPHGERRWVELKGQLLRDEAGLPVRLLGTAADVTERMELELALRRSEAIARVLARHFPGGLVGLFDKELRLRWVDGERPLPGLLPAVLQGRAPVEYAPPAQAPALIQAFQEALGGHDGQAQLDAGGGTSAVHTYPVPGGDAEGPLGLVVFLRPGA